MFFLWPAKLFFIINRNSADQSWNSTGEAFKKRCQEPEPVSNSGIFIVRFYIIITGILLKDVNQCAEQVD